MAVPKRKKNKKKNIHLFKMHISRFKKIYEPPRRLQWSSIRLIKDEYLEHTNSFFEQEVGPQDISNRYALFLQKFKKETDKMVYERGPKRKYVNLEGKKINKKISINYRKTRDKVRQKQRKNDRKFWKVKLHDLRHRLVGYNLSRLGFGKYLQKTNKERFKRQIEMKKSLSFRINLSTIKKDRTYLRPVYTTIGCTNTKKMHIRYDNDVYNTLRQGTSKNVIKEHPTTTSSKLKLEKIKKKDTKKSLEHLSKYLKDRAVQNYLGLYKEKQPSTNDQKPTIDEGADLTVDGPIERKGWAFDQTPTGLVYRPQTHDYIKKKIYYYYSKDKCHLNVKRHWYFLSKKKKRYLEPEILQKRFEIEAQRAKEMEEKGKNS